MSAELSPELAHVTPAAPHPVTHLRVVSPYENDLPVFVSRGPWRKRVVVGSTWAAVLTTATLLGTFTVRLLGV